MFFKRHTLHAMTLAALVMAAMGHAVRADTKRNDLQNEFEKVIRPFVATYCVSCHRSEQAEAKFDLSPYTTVESITRDSGHWKLVLDRLSAGEMPPEDAKEFPAPELRNQVVSWIEQLRRYEAERTAGDPGPVLLRRLSNAEYDYTIRDLTGADIRPTREFPVDPANEQGFDNSGESLAMTPALLSKYLEAARHVADHLLFLEDGLGFAPYPVVVYSDRDKFATHRIVDFYERHRVDYADYFVAAWSYAHRTELGLPQVSLEEIAVSESISPKYLRTVWEFLTDEADHLGPVAVVREFWQQLPAPPSASKTSETLKQDVREACERLGRVVLEKRRELVPPIGSYEFRPLSPSSQPLVLWKDRDVAANRRRGRLSDIEASPEEQPRREAISRFCSTFPDTFYVRERGRMFEKESLERVLAPSQPGDDRLLSAGFHLMFGFFRDDAPLYELVLDAQQQQELDRMWRELEFITKAPIRQFSDFIYFERAEGASFLRAPEFGFIREDTENTPEKIEKLAELYIDKARAAGVPDHVLEIIADYFKETAKQIGEFTLRVHSAESAHLQSLLRFAERAWRRPLVPAEEDQLLAFYHEQRNDLGVNHEEALRDAVVSVLMSPHFCYRMTEPGPGADPQLLSGHELASRLSYFLWSSMPDQELLEHAAAGDLHQVEVLKKQTTRMLNDNRSERLAVEFGGNWLDFRRFEMHQGVDRERFPQFDDALRQAMYQEPIRFFADLVRRDASILEFLDAKHTYVNRVLARHYGLPFPDSESDSWIRVSDASEYGRGGLLPMSVFLTANSPGLRTSPVKRGYWVVRRLLGEHIPPPPPGVPDLPDDESKIGELSVRDLLAKHREVASCAKCHERFDSIGLSFENYGPVGELRQKDLGGRSINSTALLPDGSERIGVEGLRGYLSESRRNDFVDNVCRKLLSYAIGRSLILSDESTISTMKQRLADDQFRFSSMVMTIVTSPQFLHKRGRDFDTGTADRRNE